MDEKNNSSAVVTAPLVAGWAPTPASKALGQRLQELRATLHVNELRHSGTRDGNLYSQWGATVGLALIERAMLLEALESIASNTCCGGCLEAARVAQSALSKTEGAQ